MFDFFNGQKTLVTIDGKQGEGIVFTRAGRSTTRFALNNVYKGLLQEDTQLVDGDIVNDGENKFFVVASRKSYRSNQAQLYKANCTVNIARLAKNYVNGTLVGMTDTVVVNDVPALQETVTANMKVFDAGLLPNTVKKLLVPKVAVQLQDTVKIGSESFQVEAINDTDYPGLLYLQCSVAKKVAK
jgi:hypothetical protein